MFQMQAGISEPSQVETGVAGLQGVYASATVN